MVNTNESNFTPENQFEKAPYGGAFKDPVKVANLMRVRRIRMAHIKGSGNIFFRQNPNNLFTVIFNEHAGSRLVNLLLKK